MQRYLIDLQEQVSRRGLLIGIIKCIPSQAKARGIAALSRFPGTGDTDGEGEGLGRGPYLCETGARANTHPV